jgi:hypothetical protein
VFLFNLCKEILLRLLHCFEVVAKLLEGVRKLCVAHQNFLIKVLVRLRCQEILVLGAVFAAGLPKLDDIRGVALVNQKVVALPESLFKDEVEGQVEQRLKVILKAKIF